MRKETQKALVKAADKLAGLLRESGFTDEASAVLRTAEGISNHDVHMKHVRLLPLQDALWWFIENVNDDTPGRSDLFFELRQRVRAEET